MCPTMQTTRRRAAYGRSSLRGESCGAPHHEFKKKSTPQAEEAAERINNLNSPAPSDIKDDDDPIPKVGNTAARALRTEMLKRRFMGAIVNAQQKLLPSCSSNGGGSAAAPQQMMMIRASSNSKEEEEDGDSSERIILLQQRERTRKRELRERKRKAARISLDKVERSVVIDEDRRVIQEFHNLYCSSSQHPAPHPLMQFGLILKDDDGDDEEQEEEEIIMDDLEEGEIVI